MFVYTFWEPRENMPFYLRLCMETWKKFLPDATIIVLDYKNIGEFLDVRELGLNLFSDGRFRLMHVADAIRAALLAKYGGVWLDVDTIILSPNAQKYFLPDEKHRTVLFGDPKAQTVHAAFINTPPNSMCMSLWREFIRERIWNIGRYESIAWDFLGNEFLDSYAPNFPDELNIIDASLTMPEKELISDTTDHQLAYVQYYFMQSRPAQDIRADMLLLHNSWTPQFYSQISPQEFVQIDCTMTNVLAHALDVKLSPASQRIKFAFKD